MKVHCWTQLGMFPLHLCSSFPTQLCSDCPNFDGKVQTARRHTKIETKKFLIAIENVLVWSILLLVVGASNKFISSDLPGSKIDSSLHVPLGFAFDRTKNRIKIKLNVDYLKRENFFCGSRCFEDSSPQLKFIRIFHSNERSRERFRGLIRVEFEIFFKFVLWAFLEFHFVIKMCSSLKLKRD